MNKQIITFSVELPEDFAQAVKSTWQRKLSWSSVDTSSLGQWESMAVRRFAANTNSYYIGAGQGDNDYFTVQGNVLACRSTMPIDSHLLYLLKEMLYSVGLNTFGKEDIVEVEYE